MAEEIEGTVKTIVFANEENGYAVIHLQTASTIVTIVGILPSIREGDYIKATGGFVQDKRFGKQFKVTTFELLPPSTVQAIESYLASGVIKGIGEKLAQRIVEAFQEKTLDILDTNPEALLSVKGISKRIVEHIEQSWQDQKIVRSLIMFLHPYGVSSKLAVRIYKVYGLDAEKKITENPYCLAMDIKGIGFLTADAIAMRFGFAKDSLHRAKAALLYAMMKCVEDGHSYYPKQLLVDKVEKEFEIPEEKAHIALTELAGMKNTIVAENHEEEEGIFLHTYHTYEQRIAHYIRRLLYSPRALEEEKLKSNITQVLQEATIMLSEEQQYAVEQATCNKVMVLTGGPGTGKTTITNCILRVFEKESNDILLAAPTGRAAKRMSETTKREAKTIHRLLEYNPQEDRFSYNANNPLSCKLLVIDECSMVDTMLMYHLLQAVPLGATLLFVGDSNQLPSVGAGNVLHDIIHSGIVPVIELTTIFRQAKESRIICNAHRIYKGEMPEIIHTKELSDFYFIPAKEPDTVAQQVVEYVQFHIPRRFGLHPVKDIQVLSPIIKGSTGVQALNTMLQKALNPKKEHIQKGETYFHLDDKVMQIKNNYDKDVFNGDVGYICYINPKERELTIRFDDKNVLYTFEELHEVTPAYSISIHKSQGSEYPAVVIPLTMQHYIMLQRNLIYTAITRGKQLVVIIGDPKAIAIAVQNSTLRKRYTRLSPRLQGVIINE
ncbi:MAG: ATP-dependent RecD-like DNA helicase [Desulfovibrionaceae bacterium]|nr:ATP-dependent RecD-like DNA helicase [Desulfovibrionaceae bacterium]